jgi:(E)-4-hydroxy-3-methylbut-2-enyl-diphosphate synthase
MPAARHHTRGVKAGSLQIGGDAPVSVQTMWKEPLAEENLSSVKENLELLAEAGCDLVRFAVPDMASADVLGSLARTSRIPLVADIHFDYRIALRCLDHPIAKIRVNPGNIGDAWKVEEVVRKARDVGVSMRIGVNGGSLPRGLAERKDQAAAMVEAAESELDILEKLDFREAAFSLKSSDVETTIEANHLFSQRHEYPLHLGVTEAGPLVPGIVKSSIGIGTLLREGVGDTIRVSLSAPPMDEVWAGNEILRTLGLRSIGVNIVSCPRCGRSSFDVHGFLHNASFLTHYRGAPLTVAVMGCVVNGPSEARHADIGITGAGSMAIIFRHGEIVRRVAFSEAVSVFEEEFAKACAET